MADVRRRQPLMAKIQHRDKVRLLPDPLDAYRILGREKVAQILGRAVLQNWPGGDKVLVHVVNLGRGQHALQKSGGVVL